jgi:hypothetical protein
MYADVLSITAEFMKAVDRFNSIFADIVSAIANFMTVNIMTYQRIRGDHSRYR